MRDPDLSLYQRAENFLMRRTNYETFKSIPYDEMALSLERIRNFLAFLGNPDRQYAIVHVAGTKGKGSVCAALDQIYRAAGYRVGLFTSPHLEEIVERFQIDGKNCDKNLFAETTCALAEQWKNFQALERKKRRESDSFDVPERPLTFFEWTLVIAVVLFARARVDVAILEVGMGGRFDSTNVCDADVSVLTSVSFDHCEQLGHTLQEIASEKLGIVKSNAPLICGCGLASTFYEDFDAVQKKEEEVRRRLWNDMCEKNDGAARFRRVNRLPDDERDSCVEQGEDKAPRLNVGRDLDVCDYSLLVDPQTIVTRRDLEEVRRMAKDKATEFNAPFVSIEALSPRVAALPTPPFDLVKRWNFEIALRVVEILANRKSAPDRRPGADGNAPVRRFPVSDAAIMNAAAHYAVPARFEIVSKAPLVVVDGAHNRASVAAFLREALERYPNKKIKVLLATTRGKDVRGMLAELASRADEIYLSQRSSDARAESLPELINETERLLDETCSEDSTIRRKFHVAPDFRAFLTDYKSRPDKGDVLCAIGSFYFAAEVRKMFKG